MTWISATLVTLTFLVPMVILTICHLRIFMIARSHHRSIAGTLGLITVSVQIPITRARGRRASQPQLPIGRRRAVHTTSYIMGAFFISYLPTSVFKMCEIITQSPQNPAWAILSALSFQLSPAINSLVYGLKNRNLRRALVEWYHRKLVNYSYVLTLPKKSRRTHQGHSIVTQRRHVLCTFLPDFSPHDLPDVHEVISEIRDQSEKISKKEEKEDNKRISKVCDSDNFKLECAHEEVIEMSSS